MTAAISKKNKDHAWLVVASSFLVHVIVGGIAYSGGIWQMIFVGYFGSTRFQAVLVSSLLLSLTAFGGIPSTLICFRYGYRVSVICGAILSLAGLMLAMFATELHELYLSLGVITGLGLGLALTPSVMVLGGYFTLDRLQFASSVAATGSSVGVVFLPIVLYLLEETYAWKGSVLVLIGVVANIAVCGILMKDETICVGRRRKRLLKIFEPTLFKSIAFDTLLICNFLWCSGSSVIFCHLPEYARSTGLSRDDAVMLLGVIGVSNFVSRVIFQLFNHSAKLDATSNFLCSAGLATIVTFLFPEFFKHKAGEIGYCIMFGLHYGYWSTFVMSVTGEVLTGDLIAYGRGYISLSVGLGYLVGPPLAAFLLDNDFSLKLIFYAAGGCLLLSSLLMLAMSVRKCYYRPDPDVIAINSNSTIGSQLSTSNQPTDTSLTAATAAATAPTAASKQSSEERAVVTSLLTAV